MEVRQKGSATRVANARDAAPADPHAWKPCCLKKQAQGGGPHGYAGARHLSRLEATLCLCNHRR